MVAATILLAFVTLQRIGEAIYGERNRRRMLAEGEVESGEEHWPYLFALHASWLVGLWVIAPGRPLVPIFVVLYVLLAVLRIWVMASLGPRWTTHIVVQPGLPRIKAGPYRFLRHPNYVVVVGELAILPLAFGLPWYALFFTLWNAVMLSIRIRAENRALAVLG
jgi:methyltransferase